MKCFDSLPFSEKINPTTCFGGRTAIFHCPCCGIVEGGYGIRATPTRKKKNAKAKKPKYKDHRK